MRYNFYSRVDENQEAIGTCLALTRYRAALYFAAVKKLDLKSFLRVYAVSR